MSDQIYIDTVRDQIKNGMYDHLLEHINGPIVFLDIGANTGEVSRYFSQFALKVVAIEPAPDTFKILKCNTKDIFPAIECHNLALASEDGPHPFFVNDINFTASSTVNTYGRRITVKGLRLSSIIAVCNLNHVDICKIDAEGAEGESLTLEELDKAKDIIKTFYIETHNCPKTSWEHKLGTLVGNLARCGYSKMRIDGMALTATR